VLLAPSTIPLAIQCFIDPDSTSFKAVLEFMKALRIARRSLLVGSLLKNYAGAMSQLQNTVKTSHILTENKKQSRGASQLSAFATMIDVPFTLVYNPVGDNLEASDFSTAAELSCTHVENFVTDVLALASTIIMLVNVFCSPVSTVFSTVIGYKLSVFIGEGSKVIPSQTDIQTLVCVSLSSDEIESLATTLPKALSISAIPCDEALTPISDQLNVDVQPTSKLTPTFSPTFHPTFTVTIFPTKYPSPGPTQVPSHYPSTGELIQTSFSSRFLNVRGISSAGDKKIVAESICAQVLEMIKGTFDLIGSAIVLEKIICSQLGTESSAFDQVDYEIYLVIGLASAFVPNQQDIASLVCFTISPANLNSLKQSFPTNNPFSSATNVTCDQKQR
jgi:hypothetical protein